MTAITPPFERAIQEQKDFLRRVIESLPVQGLMVSEVPTEGDINRRELQIVTQEGAVLLRGLAAERDDDDAVEVTIQLIDNILPECMSWTSFFVVYDRDWHFYHAWANEDQLDSFLAANEDAKIEMVLCALGIWGRLPRSDETAEERGRENYAHLWNNGLGAALADIPSVSTRPREERMVFMMTLCSLVMLRWYRRVDSDVLTFREISSGWLKYNG